MKDRQFVGLMAFEAALIGAGGAVVSLLIAGPMAYRLSTRGFYMGDMFGDLSMANVLLDPYMYGGFGPWLVPMAFGVSLLATMAASVYPAWFAIGTNPARALREG